MKRKVILEVEMPEGATHYAGILTGDPVFYKRHEFESGPCWVSWAVHMRTWIVSSQFHTDGWLKEIHFAP